MKTNGNSENRKFDLLSPRIVALGLMAGLLLLMLLGLTGCHGASSETQNRNSAGPMNLAGNYQLISVDGKTVPCTVSHEGHDVIVKSGVFAISTNATCRSQTVFSVAGNPDVHRVVDASYTASGQGLTMRWKGGGVSKGTVDADTFTMNNEGMIFAYRK